MAKAFLAPVILKSFMMVNQIALMNTPKHLQIEQMRLCMRVKRY